MDTFAIWPWLGLDSLLACAALSSRAMSGRERCALAAAFGACDALATAIAPILTADFPPVPLLSLYLPAVLLVGYRVRTRRMSMLLLPVGLSIDNLFGYASPATAGLCGVSSALLALLGLQVCGGARAALARYVSSGCQRSPTPSPMNAIAGRLS